MNAALDYQLRRFQEMTPEERWHAARRLYWAARRFKASYLRQLHPDWTEERVLDAVKESFTRVRG